MSEVKVVATVDDTDYELSGDNDLYASAIIAPEESTNIMVTATDESGNQDQGSAYLYVNNDWRPPKTNWTTEDYFNAKDYNRIIGNMAYLKAYLDDLFFNLTNISLGDDKTYLSHIYAREINNIEQSLDTLNLETYVLDIGEMQTYKANKATPLWSEFNRIESAILLLHDTMIAHKEALPKLAFTLGGQKGIKV